MREGVVFVCTHGHGKRLAVCLFQKMCAVPPSSLYLEQCEQNRANSSLLLFHALMLPKGRWGLGDSPITADYWKKRESSVTLQCVLVPLASLVKNCVNSSKVVDWISWEHTNGLNVAFERKIWPNAQMCALNDCSSRPVKPSHLENTVGLPHSLARYTHHSYPSTLGFNLWTVIWPSQHHPQTQT